MLSIYLLFLMSLTGAGVLGFFLSKTLREAAELKTQLHGSEQLNTFYRMENANYERRIKNLERDLMKPKKPLCDSCLASMGDAPEKKAVQDDKFNRKLPIE